MKIMKDIYINIRFKYMFNYNIFEDTTNPTDVMSTNIFSVELVVSEQL